ncbi:unnamed protein product [Effrenium voratum]|uniref:Uncharacterized protein n=1 Tax=Effrenium voratum TaxID=2562239 RepID=A0AA36HVS9_9DINO|nr:unnamed protein product [Effrenium voratum]CAJ1375384.1 unnamed protein product [Effrenium voratum]CAJ1417077.1 unnamed protein product [Effrenium voratum]
MALESFLGQALSRNKAFEKVDLWKEREIQDKGSRCTISLKSRKGDVVRQVTKVPEGAEVTSNLLNQFENEREANAASKEDVLLERLANGKDPAWRPDVFLSELKGLSKGGIPWKMRPQDYLRMDAAFVQKVVSAYKANKKAEKKKKKKKQKKKEKKKEKNKLKGVTGEKKEKKSKKDKKSKKQKKEKGQKEEVKQDVHVEEKRRSKVVCDAEGNQEELEEVVEVKTTKVTVRRKKPADADEAVEAEAKAARLASKLREKVAAQLQAGIGEASPSTGQSPSDSSGSSSDEAAEMDSGDEAAEMGSGDEPDEPERWTAEPSEESSSE